MIISIKGNTKSKLIKTYKVTNALIQDSQPTEDLLEDSDKGQILHAKRVQKVDLNSNLAYTCGIFSTDINRISYLLKQSTIKINF
jgi:hypothetical protein